MSSVLIQYLRRRVAFFVPQQGESMENLKINFSLDGYQKAKSILEGKHATYINMTIINIGCSVRWQEMMPELDNIAEFLSKQDIDLILDFDGVIISYIIRLILVIDLV